MQQMFDGFRYYAFSHEICELTEGILFELEVIGVLQSLTNRVEDEGIQGMHGRVPEQIKDREHQQQSPFRHDRVVEECRVDVEDVGC
jgi:hypothetical protein